MDQRICIKFCVKNKIKCADAFRMLTVAYGEATLDRSNVYRWYKMFSEGREDVNDEERAGRPSTSTTDENIDEVKKIVLANRRITVREVAEDLNISIGSCHSIFINDLGMRFDITTPRNGVTSGSRLYLQATIEINETKASTRDGMRCFLSRDWSQNGRIRLYMRAYQDTEAVPTTSFANRAASFRVLAMVKRS
ncbi:SETMR methyltransferase, partial [Acromyrmex heyeri]